VYSVASSNPFHDEMYILDTSLCDKVSPGTPVSSTYKSDRHNIAEILLKVALNTIN